MRFAQKGTRFDWSTARQMVNLLKVSNSKA